MFTSCSVSASHVSPPAPAAVPGRDPPPVGGRTGPVPAPNSPNPPAAAPPLSPSALYHPTRQQQKKLGTVWAGGS
eukprot:1959646-Rhodomonas_salina.3